MTTYNVRVGRSDKAEGPFMDYFGKELKDTTNNFPILTAPYRFKNHPGWAGTAHCAVYSLQMTDSTFMAHQGRLSPQNQMMDLHVRQVFFTEEGWPVVSPERYAGSKSPGVLRGRFGWASGRLSVCRNLCMNASWKRDRYCGVRVNCKMKNGTCLACYIWRKMESWERDKGTWDFARCKSNL